MGYVTREQIEKAKAVSIEDYILSHEPNNIKRVGHTLYLKDHDSLRISNGLWKWESRGIGGKNVIDYLIKVRGYEFIANTKGEGKSGDDFWVKAETLLYCALVGAIHFEAPPSQQNMNTLVELINSMETREDDENFKNAVDYYFEELELGNEEEGLLPKPDCFAVRQYKKYKLAAGVVS